jgi:hypothetical protein
MVPLYLIERSWVHLNKRQKSSVGFQEKPTMPRLTLDFRPPFLLSFNAYIFGMCQSHEADHSLRKINSSCKSKSAYYYCKNEDFDRVYDSKKD